MAPPAPFLDQLRARAQRLPVTSGLVAANLAVFAAMLLAGASLWHAPNSIQLTWGANFGPATKSGEWWRLFTAMFLHFGLLHLLVNMTALVEAGRFVERSLGSLYFLLLYCGGGLAGNLLSLAVHGDHGISGGASGAVFAVFGALLAILWRERAALDAGEFRWLFGGAALLAVANIALGRFVPGIDNGAHVGGFCFGVLATIALDAGFLSGRRTAAPVRGVAATVLAASLGGIIANLPAPSYDWHDELAARSEIGSFLGVDADISGRWHEILEQGNRPGQSFEELAQRIEIEVSDRYEESFAHLASIRVDPRTPSSSTLRSLQRYAELRRDAAYDLAGGLRLKDSVRILRALDQAREAGAVTHAKADH